MSWPAPGRAPYLNLPHNAHLFVRRAPSFRQEGRAFVGCVACLNLHIPEITVYAAGKFLCRIAYEQHTVIDTQYLPKVNPPEPADWYLSGFVADAVEPVAGR